MNADLTLTLRQALMALMEDERRSNTFKSQKYWYPIAHATYDIEEIMTTVNSLCSFQTTMLEKTSQFETEFSGLLPCKESIMVNSGSSADLLIAYALVNPQVKLLAPGDEILVPSVTWPTQVWSALMAGLKVKFVDADPNTLNMDLNDLAEKISSQTKAISLVHLLGNPCDMDIIQTLCKKHGLLLIEDCCEALGAKFKGQAVGTFGLASSFSFFLSHHITTMEGGMICCQDETLSDIFRVFRAHGWARGLKYSKPPDIKGFDDRYLFLNWGFNVRPTELQAGFGLEQLKRLPVFDVHRKRNAQYFEDYVRSRSAFIKTMQVHPNAECSWLALPIVLTDECPFTKHELVTYLEDKGVETRPIVAGNLARQPACEWFPEMETGELPGADIIHDRGFYLGLYPLDAKNELEQLMEIFENYLQNYE